MSPPLSHDSLPGRAPALVLVPGWTCTRWAMRPVADAFPEFARILPDLAGHGLSPAASDYAITTQARAVLAIMQQPMWVAGHSMGAQVAIEMAHQAPDRVRGVVLLDPPPLTDWEPSLAMIASVNAHLQSPDVIGKAADIFRGWASGFPDTADRERLIADVLAMDADIARRAFQAVVDYDGPAKLASLPCPALVITAEKSSNRLGDLRAVNDRIMTAQVAGADHMLQFEAMDQIAPMVRRWLALNPAVASDG